MLEKLDFMTRFWVLRARHGQMGAPLSAVERLELLSLLHLMSTDHRLPEPGPPPGGDGVPVQITGPGGFFGGDLRMVCADGVVLSCAAPLVAGQSTIVRLVDTPRSIEYTLPCVVAWAFGGHQAALALRVDGAPSQVCFEIPDETVYPSQVESASRPLSSSR